METRAEVMEAVSEAAEDTLLGDNGGSASSWREVGTVSDTGSCDGATNEWAAVAGADNE